MILEALSVNPLLIIESNSNSDGVLGNLQLVFLLFRRSFSRRCFDNFLIFRSRFFLLVFLFLVAFSLKHPREWRDSAADGAVFAVPVSSHFTDSFFAVSLKLDALDGGVIQSATTDDQVSSTFNRSKVRLYLLDLNIIVSERDGPACELLSVKSNIDIVTHVISLEVVEVRHSSSD